jgi:hypothetical protein
MCLRSSRAKRGDLVVATKGEIATPDKTGLAMTPQKYLHTKLKLAISNAK